MNISLYKTPKTTQKEKDIPFLDFVKDIQTGKYETQIAKLRSLTGQAQKDFKINLPAVTLSGIFQNAHVAKGLIQHSGLIQIDIDKRDDLEELRKTLYEDRYTFCGFISPSGNGLKLAVKIPPETAQHRNRFLALEKYYKEQYNVEIDKACKDVNRLCYVSHDTELFLNENADTFTDIYQNQPVNSKENPIPQTKSGINSNTNDYYYNSSNFDEFVREMELQHINITNGYDNWLKVGFAIAGEFNAGGLDYFDRFSRLDTSYNPDAVREQYNKCLRGNNGTTEIKTVFSMAKNAGLTIPEKKTAHFKTTNNQTGDKNTEDNSQLIAERKEYDYYKNKDINEIMECDIPQSVDIENDIQFFGVYSQNNMFFSRINAGKGTKDVSISNFIISILFQFDEIGRAHV